MLTPSVEFQQYSAARGSKSRNKVAVGEPAAGSLPKSDRYSSLKSVLLKKELAGKGLANPNEQMLWDPGHDCQSCR